MTDTSSDWLSQGQGHAPVCRWAVGTDAPLVSLETARESGETLVADVSGGLYLLDRQGRIVTITRSFQSISLIAWSDVGTLGALIEGDSQLILFDNRLRVLSSRKLKDAVLSLAIEPGGQCLGVGLASGENLILGTDGSRVGRFTTDRPLRHLRFLATSREILGAAEYGLLCRFQVQGVISWSEKLWSNAGDLAVTGDGRKAFVAAYSYGIQQYDERGTTQGSFVVDGTPCKISVSEARNRLAVGAIERRLYFMTVEGNLLWGAVAPDDITRVIVDPLGRFLTCGLAGGRVLRLSWEHAV